MNAVSISKKLGLIATIVGLVCFQLAVSTLAVEPGKTSYTAEVVCAFRAIAAKDPDPKTRNPDYLAGQFVSPEFSNRFPGFGLDFEDAKIAMDAMNTGGYYYVNARTHHIDTILKQTVKGGVKQVVVLGAGYDSRAYRYRESFPNITFFEVDLPATIQEKQKRVTKILGTSPDWVRYAPIDFNTQTLKEVLSKVGYDAGNKTLFVWEGVTYFISEAGVDSTLRFIANQSAPGSSVVFDYMLQAVFEGDYSYYGARKIIYHVALRGEPYIFGIEPKAAENFINQRGLKMLSDIGPKELTRRYLIRSNGSIDGRIAEFVRIVHARVPQPQEMERLIKTALKEAPQYAREGDPDKLGHKIKLPHEVKDFLTTYEQDLVSKDISKIMDHFSDNFQSEGKAKQDVQMFFNYYLKKKTFKTIKIFLTKFNRQGSKASVDGYIRADGITIPMTVSGIIKEKDGKWRWL